MPREGHLVVQSTGLYAAFHASIAENYVHPPRYFSYGRIIAKAITDPTTDEVTEPNAWRMARTEREGRLVPEARGSFDTQLWQHIMMVATNEVDDVLADIGERPYDGSPPPPSLPADRLYHAAAGRMLGGMTIEACGTYGLRGGEVELVVVDGKGGYSLGGNTMHEPAYGHLPELVGAEYWTS